MIADRYGRKDERHLAFCSLVLQFETGLMRHCLGLRLRCAHGPSCEYPGFPLEDLHLLYTVTSPPSLGTLFQVYVGTPLLSA